MAEIEVVSPSEIDYTIHTKESPIYNLQRLTQQTGGTQVIVPVAGGSESLFELPQKTYNLSKSYIKFDVQVPDNGNAALWTFIACNTIPFWQQIQLMPRGGGYLVNIDNAEKYCNMVVPRETKLEDFLDFETWDATELGNATTGPTSGAMFRPVNNLTRGAGNAATNGVYYDDTTITMNYTEMQYVIGGYQGNAGQQGNPAGAGTAAFSCTLPLSLFKNTLFDVDKDLYYGQIMLLRFVWSSFAKYIWTTTQNNDPNTGAAAYPSPNININNLYLFLAVEDNQTISRSLQSAVESGEGMKLVIPYVHSDKRTLAGNNQVVSLRYNRAHGMTLKKIYSAVYSSPEATNHGMDHNNYDGVNHVFGTKILNFQSLLNGDPLQRWVLDCQINKDDYLLQKESLRGSMIQGNIVFGHNWTWLQDFTHQKNPLNRISNISENTLIAGLPLGDMEQKYDLVYTTVAANYTHMSYTITTKSLIISRDGVAAIS